MSHFIIKLITGDTIYGKMQPSQKEGEQMVIVEDPLQWEEFYTEEGYPASTLTRYCSGSDETEIPIARSAIISMAAMNEDFADFYDAAVGMTDMSAAGYKVKLRGMTCNMLNKLQAYHAAQIQEETGQLVQYQLHDLYDLDTDTIH